MSLNLEPSAVFDSMNSVASTADLSVEVRANPTKYGVLHNPWDAINNAFARDSSASFVVLGEEDIVVSSDIIEYFSWAKNAFSPTEALTISAWGGGTKDVGSAFLCPWFGGLIWGCWRESWEGHLRDTWDHDYSTHNGVPGLEAGWDWNLNTRVGPSVGKGCAVPVVPKCKHIGRLEGTHMSANDFDRAESSNPPGFISAVEQHNFQRLEASTI